MMQALREDMSARELERKISDLKRDRVRIEDAIRRMDANQQRIFREDTTARNRIQVAQEEEGKPDIAEKEDRDKRKRRRSGSGSGSDSESKKSDKEANGDKEDKKGEDDKDIKDDKEERDDKDAKDGRESKDGNEGKAEEAGEAKDGEEKRKTPDTRPKKSDPRSRNLFGKLLGHLHSAKSRLESEKGSKAAELNAKAQERIQEKLSLSKMNIKEFRKSQFEQRKKEEEAKVAQIEKNIEEMELLLLQKRLEGHYSLMMNFIRTKAEPTIFYLPAKHTKDTELALEETRAAIKHKTASLKVQLQPVGEEAQAEDALRASAAAAAAALVAVPAALAKEDGQGGLTKEDDGDVKDDDADAKNDAKSTPVKDKPESDKKQAPSDDEEDQEEKEAADDKAADSDASSPKKRKASAGDDGSKSKKRKEGGSASESGK